MVPKTGKKSNQRLMLWVVIPLFSCAISSLIGMAIGQIGNLLLSIFGSPPTVLIVMVFLGLFVLSFGLSFFLNGWLRKWLLNPQRARR